MKINETDNLAEYWQANFFWHCLQKNAILGSAICSWHLFMLQYIMLQHIAHFNTFQLYVGMV